MAKFIKVKPSSTIINGVSNIHNEDYYIINIKTIKHIYVNEIYKYATIYLDNEQITTTDIDELSKIVEEDTIQETTNQNMSLKDFCNLMRWPRYRDRVYGALMRNGIKNLQGLIDLGQRGLKRVPGVGDGAFKAIIMTANENDIEIPRLGKRD